MDDWLMPDEGLPQPPSVPKLWPDGPLPAARAVGSAPDPGELPAIAPLAPDLVGEPTEQHHLAVQAALYRRAVGSVTWEERLDKFGGVQVVRSDVPPDAGAARDWLRAHKPDQWGERKQHDVRVIVARLGAGSEREGVGQAIEAVIADAVLEDAREIPQG